jgi:predicted nuclease with TOPRIM domain
MDELRDFKDKLITLFKKELSASDKTCKEIDGCNSLSEIKQFFEKSKDLESLFDFEGLKSDIEDLEGEVENLEDKVDTLENTVTSLENEISELEAEIFSPETYWDEEKYELFLKYHNKFTPTEFEELLTKG